MDPRRSERVTEAMRIELEEILNYELADPRIRGCAVTEVILSPDGRKAMVRLAARELAGEARESLEALARATGHIRHLLADRLDLFRVPEIQFEADADAGSAERVRSLLRRVRKGRARDRDDAPPQ